MPVSDQHAHKSWSLQEMQVLRDLYPEEGANAVSNQTGRSLASVKSKAKQLRLVSARQHYFPWSPREVAQLLELYPTMDTQELAKRMGRRHESLHNKAKRLNVRKSDDFRRHPGQFHQGVKMTCIAPLKRRPGAAIGTEKFMSARGYLMRKVSDTGHTGVDWQKVHRILWEEVNGPIPEGNFVIFLDGNKANVTINNLALLPSNDAARRASEVYRSYPRDLRVAIRALAKLKRVIKGGP